MLLDIEPSLLETLEEKLPSNEKVAIQVTLDDAEPIVDLNATIERILRDAAEAAEEKAPSFTILQGLSFTLEAPAAFVKILVRQRNFKSAALLRKP